jgi:hypothetical protein
MKKATAVKAQTKKSLKFKDKDEEGNMEDSKTVELLQLFKLTKNDAKAYASTYWNW